MAARLPPCMPSRLLAKQYSALTVSKPAVYGLVSDNVLPLELVDLTMMSGIDSLVARSSKVTK